MSNTITAFFKGRVGVAEAVYQNDYGLVMNLDGLDLPAHFDCYFSTLEQDEAIPGIGADNQVVIPNDCLSRAGNVTLHIPLHTGQNDSEVEYIVYFKVIGRARPVDDGTPVQMTAIEQALALLQNPIGNIEQIVNEALAFTGDTFAEMQDKLDQDQAAYESSMTSRADAFESGITSRQDTVESQFSNLTTNLKPNSADVLWTGKELSGTLTLSESISNYDFIDIEFYKSNTSGTDDSTITKRIPATAGIYWLRNFALDYDNKQVGFYEQKITLADRSITAEDSYNIDGSESAWTKQRAVYNLSFKRVLGIKMGKASNAELTDIRVGADSVTYASAGAAVRTQLTNLKSDLNSITIEGYEKEAVPVLGTLHDNKFINGNNLALNDSTAWECLEIDTIEGGATYYVSGSSGSAARLYILFDTRGNWLYTSDLYTSVTRFDDLEVKMPDNAKYIYVNAQKIQGHASVKKKTYNYKKPVSTPLAVNTSGDKYTVGAEAIKNNIDLSGSQNGLFNFELLNNADDTLFKNAIDDITPIYIGENSPYANVGYVGANHGYMLAYKATFGSAHGLTVADIGKVYTASNNYKYVLIQVLSTTELVIGFYDATRWYKVRPIIFADTYDFGTGSITATSQTMIQLYPSVKNGNVEIVENTEDMCRIAESYDIIDFGSGIDAIIANVGNNDNYSYCTLADSAFTVRNMYEFHKNGSVTIYQNLKVLKDGIKLDRYGGVQSQPFGSSDNFAVAQSSYKALTASSGSAIAISKATWDDETVPPILFLQTDNSLASMTKAFATGMLVDHRTDYISTMAGVFEASRKMYPYAIEPSAVVEKGKVYSFISFRVPFTKNEYSATVPFVSYTWVYKDIYLFVVTTSAVDTSVALPTFMRGMRADVVMSDGITCETTNVIDAVDIKSSGTGYLILKLSE